MRETDAGDGEDEARERVLSKGTEKKGRRRQHLETKQHISKEP